jgi:hypothetical protein
VAYTSPGTAVALRPAGVLDATIMLAIGFTETSSHRNSPLPCVIGFLARPDPKAGNFHSASVKPADLLREQIGS